MADPVQVVDLRDATQHSRRNSLRKRRPSDAPRPQEPQRGRSTSVGSERRYALNVKDAPPVPPSILRSTQPHSPPIPTTSRHSNYSHRVPVPSASGTVINVPSSHQNNITMQRQSSGHSSRPPVSQSYPDRGRQRRSSSASRRTTASAASSSRPTTPAEYNMPSSSSNVRVRNRTPTEQVMYIPSGQPIIIIDERRNKNTPLPTVIRDGKVVLGGDGRTRAQLAGSTRTIVRSDPGTPVHRGEHGQSNVVINRSSTQRQSRFTELDPHGRPQSQHRHNRSDSQVRPTVVADAPRRRDTWGHKNRREPPFGHHDSRCHSPWHGLKDWWFGILMRNEERKRQGNAEYEDAHRERDFERRKREKEYSHNVAAWKNGRRDVHLW